MYAIETTPGFILEARPCGEADKLLSVFTRDFGLIRSVAPGIRLEKSKLRYFTGEHSFGTFSFVRGKDLWRLTHAEQKAAPLTSELLARLALILRRFLQGEEPHQELFDCVQSLETFLRNNPGLTSDELVTLESLIMLRVMKNLGYIGDDDKLGDEAVRGDITRKILADLADKRVLLNRHVNKALKESHL